MREEDTTVSPVPLNLGSQAELHLTRQSASVKPGGTDRDGTRALNSIACKYDSVSTEGTAQDDVSGKTCE